MNLSHKGLEVKPLIDRIYKGKTAFHIRDEIAKEVLVSDVRRFHAQNLLPKGWTILRKDGGSSSLEAFLSHWLTYEWGMRGPVDRRNTTYPYDTEKIAWLMLVVFQIQYLTDGTFIQWNKDGNYRIITNVRTIMRDYFGFLYNYGNSQVFQKVFDTYFWQSKEIKRNPQFIKSIPFSDEVWGGYFIPTDLNETRERVIITEKLGGYSVNHVRESFLSNDSFQLYSSVHEIIKQVVSNEEKSGFITNDLISSQLQPLFHKEKLSSQRVLNIFDEIALSMRVKVETKRAAKGVRGRQLSVIQTEVTEETELKVSTIYHQT